MAVQKPRGVQEEQPVLWLGMVGFAPTQRKSIEAAVARATGSAQWRICPFGDADGWWVNGAKCSITEGGRLKVAPGLPTEHTLRLELPDVDRPLAFAEPVAPANLEALCVFDPASEAGIHATLGRFEKWLQPVRVRFALGAMLLARDSEDRRGTYHLSHRSTLLAVVDFQQGMAAIAPKAQPPDLWEAVWEKRPSAAGLPPHGFKSSTITELAWSYVRRTERDMLPARYRTEKIFYRHVPRVPMRQLRDSQLMLLRELSAEPGTLQSLFERTAVPLPQLAHDLACLYYAGSVTTSPETIEQGAGPDVNSVGLWPESVASTGGDSRSRHDLTAPAILERRPRPARSGDEA